MSIDVSEKDFESLVLKKSFTVPVLVDFWAEWCAPCRMLGPVLEKLEKEKAGEFLLAKVNTDYNPNISLSFKISGIPAVKLFSGGKVIAEFTGALPEKSVKEFLSKHIVSKETKELLLLKSSDIQKAAAFVTEKKLTGEEAEEILWSASIDALSKNDSLKTQELLHDISEIGGKYSDHRNYLLQFLSAIKSQDDIQNILKIVNKENKREGLEYFLQKVEQATKSERANVKDDLITCFFLLGNSDELINEYRRRLSSLLY
jgi:putative thioredoxin